MAVCMHACINMHVHVIFNTKQEEVFLVCLCYSCAAADSNHFRSQSDTNIGSLDT